MTSACLFCRSSLRSAFFQRLMLLFFLLVFTLLSSKMSAQVWENLAMDFSGSTDHIFLSASGTPLSGDADFTLEASFLIAPPPTACTNSSRFRRLFSLTSTSGPFSLFEIGECAGILTTSWTSTTAGSNGPFTSVAIGSGWHHIAVVRNKNAANELVIYLDGQVAYSRPVVGTLNIGAIRIGHPVAGGPIRTWLGQVDEVRLWSIPRTAADIQAFKDCTIMGSSPDLVANWTFDQTTQGVVANGPNNGFMAEDMSGNLNHGILNNFALSGPTSNFVSNFCPPPFHLDIDDINVPGINLVSICSGDPARFCVTQNGQPVSLPAGATVKWEYFDFNTGINNWLSVPFTNNTFQSLCFGVPKGGLDISTSLICDPNIGTGFVDRKYRAIITQTVNGLSCVYTTSEYNLQICCPPRSCTSLQLVSQPIAAPLCEGDVVTLSASINYCDNWLQFTPGLNIDWCLIDGTGTHLLSQYHNFSSINHPYTAGTKDVCIQAKISNCTCPDLLLEECIAVDPIPKCGAIAPMAGTSSLCPDPDGIFNHYLICPGDEVTLEMVSPFTDCNPTWQYRFDTTIPPGSWIDLGSSNSSQNTNSIPSLSPPNWPAGTTYIFYRIECRPLSWPNSGCDPCHSNEIRIGLKPPLPKPTIGVPANQICKGDPAFFSVTNFLIYPGTPQFNWFCNAELQPTQGQYFNAFQQACYWVEVSDGCYKEESEKECIEVCEVVPIIKCPTDPPCVCLGQPITLSGCDSYNTCNTGPLPLVFTWSNTSGTPCIVSGPNGCNCTHIPDATGTTYTLTVTDPNLGCTATTTLFIKPCF